MLPANELDYARAHNALARIDLVGSPEPKNSPVYRYEALEQLPDGREIDRTNILSNDIVPEQSIKDFSRAVADGQRVNSNSSMASFQDRRVPGAPQDEEVLRESNFMDFNTASSTAGMEGRFDMGGITEGDMTFGLGSSDVRGDLLREKMRHQGQDIMASSTLDEAELLNENIDQRGRAENKMEDPVISPSSQSSYTASSTCCCKEIGPCATPSVVATTTASLTTGNSTATAMNVAKGHADGGTVIETETDYNVYATVSTSKTFSRAAAQSISREVFVTLVSCLGMVLLI